MSEANKTQASQDDTQAGSESADQQSVQNPDNLLRQVKEAAAEAKKYRQTNAELKAKLEAIENERLAQEGKWKEIAEKERKRAEEAEKKAKSATATFAVRTIEGQLKAEAARLGCVDSDALLKLVDLGEFEVDEEYNVNQDRMKNVFERMQKEKSYLFPKQAPNPRDLPPGGGKETFKEKSIKDMTLEEKIALLNKVTKTT